MDWEGEEMTSAYDFKIDSKVDWLEPIDSMKGGTVVRHVQRLDGYVTLVEVRWPSGSVCQHSPWDLKASNQEPQVN